MDTAQLIIACKNNERLAQKELYEKYAPIMLGVCIRYCGDSDLARDILHDGFVRLFTQIHTYKGEGVFEGWMRRIFVNLALENYRKEKKWLETQNEYAHDQKVLYSTDNEGADSSFTSKQLLSVLDELPEGYRTVFNMYAIDDMSHKEIAFKMGISENTSRSQYSRARALIQKKLKKISNNKDH